MKPDLEALPGLIALVEKKRAALPDFDWKDREPYDRALKAMAQELSAAGARINDRWNGATISFGGVRSSSTGGLSRALGNWLRAARAKCEESANG